MGEYYIEDHLKGIYTLEKPLTKEDKAVLINLVMSNYQESLLPDNSELYILVGGMVINSHIQRMQDGNPTTRTRKFKNLKDFLGYVEKGRKSAVIVSCGREEPQEPKNITSKNQGWGEGSIVVQGNIFRVYTYNTPPAYHSRTGK